MIAQYWPGWENNERARKKMFEKTHLLIKTFDPVVNGHWGAVQRTQTVSLMMYHYNFMADKQQSFLSTSLGV